MLDENDNDRGWKLADEALDYLLVYSRSPSSFETPGDCAQYRELIMV